MYILLCDVQARELHNVIPYTRCSIARIRVWTAKINLTGRYKHFYSFTQKKKKSYIFPNVSFFIIISGKVGIVLSISASNKINKLYSRRIRLKYYTLVYREQTTKPRYSRWHESHNIIYNTYIYILPNRFFFWPYY